MKSTIDTLKKGTLLASNPSSFLYVNVPSLRYVRVFQGYNVPYKRVRYVIRYVMSYTGTL